MVPRRGPRQSASAGRPGRFLAVQTVLDLAFATQAAYAAPLNRLVADDADEDGGRKKAKRRQEAADPAA